MKEFGPRYNPEEYKKTPPEAGEALTSEARNPYASSGAKSMDGNGNQENPLILNPREANNLPPQPIINPSVRPPQRVITSAEARLAPNRGIVDKRGHSQWSEEGKLSFGFDEKNPYSPQELAQRANAHAEYDQRAQLQQHSPEQIQFAHDFIDAHGFVPTGIDWEHQAGSGAKFHNLLEERITFEPEIQQFNVENERERPENFNQLLVEIMKNSDPKWGPGGEFPLMEVDPATRKVKINQANFLEWAMERMVFYHGEDPDNTQLNLFQKVRLERDFRDITIIDMLENEDRYFRDFNNNQYKELADQVRLRFWQFAAFRSDFLEYNLAMGDDSSVNKVLAKQFYNNSHSKTAFHGQSVLTNILTMSHKFTSNPQSYEERRQGKAHDVPEDNDTNLGNGVNTSFLIYYNIGDYEKLHELLGSDDKYLLNPDYVRHEIIRQAAAKGFLKRKLTPEDEDANGNYLMSILTPEEINQVKSFVESTSEDPKGSADFLFKEGDISKEKIIEFINLYNMTTKHPEAFNISRGLVRRAIKDRYKLGDASTDYAEQMAFFMSRPMGAGWRNDMMANANDATTKVAKMRKYREKMASGSRVGMYGNPYSMYMLKSGLVDYLSAARTTTVMKDEHGNDILDAYGNKHYYSIMELMEKLHHMGKNENGGEESKAYMGTAKLISPTVNSERQWAQDHMNRAFEIYHDVVESNEIDWSKFTEEDGWGNIRLNRGAFEKEVKDHFFKIIRYCYSTYDQLDFSKTVRTHTIQKDHHGKDVDKWVDQPLVLSLFGSEILDIPEFWKQDLAWNDDGTPIMEDYTDSHGHKGRRQKVLKTYSHVIDPERIQANKELLWKQVALGRLAADVFAHRDYFSLDKRHNNLYYFNMVEALESLSDGLMGDEDNLKATKRKGHAFSHEQIKWFKKHAGITTHELYRNQIISDFFGGSAAGLGEVIKKLFGDLTKIA